MRQRETSRDTASASARRASRRATKCLCASTEEYAPSPHRFTDPHRRPAFGHGCGRSSQDRTSEHDVEIARSGVQAVERVEAETGGQAGAGLDAAGAVAACVEPW